MLENVDFSAEPLSKEAYKPAHDALIERLVVLQQQARQQGVGLVVLFEGWNGAGKGSRISDLMYNLDARATTVNSMPEIDECEMRAFMKKDNGVTGFFPLMQPFWKELGERGTITFFDRGWYGAAAQRMLVHAKPKKKSKQKKRARRYAASIHDFEQGLVNDGYIVVKFFMHVTKRAQRERLERLHGNPATRWRVPDKKLASAKNYDELYGLYDTVLKATNFEFAPWVLVNGEDKRAANILIAQTLVDAIEGGLARKAAAGEAAAVEAAAEVAPAGERALPAGISPEHVAASRAAELTDPFAIAQVQHWQAPRASRFAITPDYPRVDAIDTTLALDEDEYKSELDRLQKELFRLENIMYQRRIPLIVMYEGWDAAGKGGNIKRVAQALDARAYTIFPSPAPTKPELAHPHLWRYWTRLPKAGHVGLYDRTWYGRVLVERVEELTPPERWAQGYDEINEFERDLVNWGAIVLKFWVNVSPEEQLRRFEARAADSARQWKITDEDWRNREKYPQYKAAIDDMFRLTSTEHVPWIVLESDDKKYARVKALRIIVDALKERLGA